MAVAIDLEMQVRAGGEAGRADIADHLAAADVLAAAHRAAAHMAIAGAEPAAVAALHIIAEAAGAAGPRHRAVGRGMGRREIGSASCRERGSQYGWSTVVAVSYK